MLEAGVFHHLHRETLYFVILAPETAENEAIEIAEGMYLTHAHTTGDIQLSVGVNSFPPIRNSLKRQKSCTKVELNPPHKLSWAHGKTMTPMWCHWAPEALPRNHSLGKLQDNLSQDRSNTKHSTTYIPQSFNPLYPDFHAQLNWNEEIKALTPSDYTLTCIWSRKNLISFKIGNKPMM